MFDMCGYVISPVQYSLYCNLQGYIFWMEMHWHASNNYIYRVLFVLYETWVIGLWKTQCSFSPVYDNENVEIH
jgi:hypothetical protein